MHPENSSNYLVPYDERIANRAKKVRCRRCGHRSFEALTICPACGRSRRTAISRWVTWGIPAAIVALLLLSLWGISGLSPLAWATAISQRMGSLTASLGAQIEPRVTAPESVLTPLPPTQNQNQNFTIEPNDSPAVQVLTPISNEAAVAQSQGAQSQGGQTQGGQTQGVQTQTELSRGSTVDTNVAAAAQPVAQEPSGPQEAPDQTAPTQESATPIDPTSTPISLAQSARSASASTSASPRAQPTTTPTKLPTKPPTRSPTASATPATLPTTLSTSTPVPATSTPEPQTQYRAEAIVLQLPDPGAVLDCAKDNIVSWRVPLSLVATDRFLLNLGYISGQSGDQYVVTWIAKQKFSIDKTSWVLDPAYCKLSSDDFNNQWVWTMQVIDENDTVVSEPSRTWYFVWQKPL